MFEAVRRLYSRYRGALMAIIVLVIISPLFGVILANAVNYTEPLDRAAEKLGLHEVEWHWTPFTDYTVPHLPDTIGYIVSGFIGVAVILVVGAVITRWGGASHNA